MIKKIKDKIDPVELRIDHYLRRLAYEEINGKRWIMVEYEKTKRDLIELFRKQYLNSSINGKGGKMKKQLKKKKIASKKTVKKNRSKKIKKGMRKVAKNLKKVVENLRQQNEKTKPNEFMPIMPKELFPPQELKQAVDKKELKQKKDQWATDFSGFKDGI